MEQRNSVQFIILTFVISIAMIAIAFGVSTAVNAISSTEDSYFGNQTYIGPVKVDGLSREQAALILTQETESWKSEQKTVIQLILEKVKLDPSLIEFDIQTSVDQAVSGKRNPLLQSINEQSINQLVDDLALSNHDELDLEQLKEDIVEHARHLTELPKTIHLTNYFLDSTEESMIFASHSMSDEEDDVSAANWVRKHQEIVIKEDAVFSLNELFLNQPDGLHSAQFQNDLASMIYKSALNAPFSIVERHITTDNRYNQEVGYEAFIDAQHDLKIKNEYGKELKIVSSLVGGELTITVEGEKTPLEIQEIIGEQKVLKPRVIVYPVENYSDEYEVAGENGVQATVIRSVRVGDAAWKTYTHAVDSYFPEHERWYRVFEDENEQGQEEE